MTSINLNGTSYNLEKSKLKIKETLPDWEREIFLFLVDWFSSDDFITVQTSGSTGTPKKIKAPKKALHNSALMTGEYFRFKKNNAALLCLPARFIAGKMMLVRAIIWELNLTYIEPKIELNIPIKNYSFSAMTAPQAKANLTQLDQIETLIIGGGPIDFDLDNELKKLQVNSFSTYGMTETVSHIALREIKNSSQEFTVLPGISISKDARDCLIINAPKLHDQTLITNDLIELKSSHSFVWKGRIDHIINSGGVKLSPENIERKITSYIKLPFFVFGIPDKKWGEQVSLIIESEDALAKDKLIKINAALSKHERIQRVLFTPKFARTANGKIQRKETYLQIST